MNAESPKTRMDANAKFALAGAPLYTVEEKIKRIEEVTCEEIRQLAKACMDLSRCSICVVGNRAEGNFSAVKRIWNGLRIE